jgi:hypothetical protein
MRHALQMRLMRPDRQVLKRRKHLDELPASHYLLSRIPLLPLHSRLRLIGIIFLFCPVRQASNCSFDSNPVDTRNGGYKGENSSSADTVAGLHHYRIQPFKSSVL